MICGSAKAATAVFILGKNWGPRTTKIARD